MDLHQVYHPLHLLLGLDHYPNHHLQNLQLLQLPPLLQNLLHHLHHLQRLYNQILSCFQMLLLLQETD